jgi:UDP-N-acetylglucosamine acyltransferase
MPEISRHAVVERSAELADDVCVGPFAYIGPKVRLGPGCVIDSGATITGQTTLGAKCHVFPMAIVGVAQDGREEGRCLLGQANRIREHVTLCGGVERPTMLGDDNLIMIGCRIGPEAAVGSHCILSNYTQIDGGATIEDYVGTSAFTFVASGMTVGAYTYVVGFTGIDDHAPPYAMVQGFPFRVRGVNSEKLRRCGFGDDDVRALKDAFRQLFNETGAAVDEQALERLSAQADLNGHVRRLIEAVRRHGERRGGA